MCKISQVVKAPKMESSNLVQIPSEVWYSIFTKSFDFKKILSIFLKSNDLEMTWKKRNYALFS